MTEKLMPYNQHLDYRYIKHLRLIRNKTQADFGKYMRVDTSTVSKLETGQMDFTPHYEAKLREAIYRLRISNFELAAVRDLIIRKEATKK